MSKVASKISEIKTEKIGATGKRALIVEGKDDVEAFQAFLRKKNQTWDQHWVVADAAGKTRVIEILKAEPDWIGVVDRDEWTDAEAVQAKVTYPQLFVLPRFCVESYLTDPTEIWSALPDVQRAFFARGEIDLREAIEANLVKWKRHAALWHVIHPIYRHMRSSDHRDTLLDPNDVPDDAKLTNIVTEWLTKFDAARISRDVGTKIRAYDQTQAADVYRLHLYAKKFYPMVVHTVLNSFLGQQQEQVRWQQLLRTLPLPDDLTPLWTLMGV